MMDGCIEERGSSVMNEEVEEEEGKNRLYYL